MAAKKKSRVKSSPVKPGSLALPAGFREIGALVPFWDMQRDYEITGEVKSFGLIPGKEVKKKDPKSGKNKLVKEPDRKTIILKCSDGRSRTVGQSGALRVLFAEAKRGDSVYLRYNGKRKDKKDPSIQYNDITVAIATPEDDAETIRATPRSIRKSKTRK